MDAMDALSRWMVTEGRRCGDPVKVVSHFCTTLIEAGVPLWRVNIGQRFANPLLIAWGWSGRRRTPRPTTSPMM